MKTKAPRLPIAAASLSFAAALALLPQAAQSQDKQQDRSLLSKELQEALKEKPEVMQDLIKRAMKNGGNLQLDQEEFRRLMDSAAVDEGDKKDAPEKDVDKSKAEENPIKGFMEMFQRRMQGRKVGTNEKEHGSILREYRPVIKDARSSTVRLVRGRKQVALGTVVDSDGLVITKASEVKGKGLRCVFPGGIRVEAEVLDVFAPLDLALVKVSADGLDAADFDTKTLIDPGSFLAAPGVGEDPIAIGVASVAKRSLSEKTKGFLGVTPEGIVGGGVRIASVIAGAPSAKAGFKVGDVVLAINGEKVLNRAQFHRMIAGRRPGEEIVFGVRRGEDDKELTAKLVSRDEYAAQNGGGNRSNPRVDRMNTMGGKLSDNRNGYTTALQTDLTLEPEQCGGPLVNLDGKVIGVNIARGGRVKSYAIPASDLKSLLGDLDSGKFSVRNLTELKRAVQEASEAFEKAEEALKAAREAKAEADRALKAAEEK